ncbi:MAG: 2-dehydro-3-deoxygalactonokinase [Candidatus Symbiobacter sp.]|nr:2-dehydro-3-deoxygalactonokinase [Candidatus Symbiobacter sp.]
MTLPQNLGKAPAGEAPAGKAPDWIAVDWGTSRLRAYAMRQRRAHEGGLAAKELCLAAAESEFGAGKLKPDEFEAKLLEVITPWLAAVTTTPVPVYICGMAGARGGWVEAAYGDSDDDRFFGTQPPLAHPPLTPQAALKIAVAIVPGLKQQNPPDVMRGEETQILGWLARLSEDANQGDAVSDAVSDAASAAVAKKIKIILPGTHSKWVSLTHTSAGKWHLDKFTTYMTGEIFSLLSEHSLLQRSLSMDDAAKTNQAVDQSWFHRGLDQAARSGVMASLFGIRAESLLNNVPPHDLRAYLSGLLIGAELAAEISADAPTQIIVIGAENLAKNYQMALAAHHCQAQFYDGAAMALAGLEKLFAAAAAHP